MFQYTLYFYQTIILFAVFSFIGWIIETVYRTITHKQFMNAGYMFGPFTPIYGVGGIVIIIAGIFMRDISFPVQLLLFGLLTTLLELVVGILLQLVFGHRLWSYDGYFLNFRGVICLKYSFIWAVLSWVFFYLIFPATFLLIDKIPAHIIKAGSIVIAVYFITDLFLSTLVIADFFRKAKAVYRGFLKMNNADIRNLFEKFIRLRNAFPHLNQIIEHLIHDGVKERVGALFSRLPGASKNPRKKKIRTKKISQEYMDIISDIIENPEFKRLRNFYHHNSTIYEHAQQVSYISYVIAKKMRLDYWSAARGALLHDFFLYDWRNHDLPDLARNKYHGHAHPKIALQNARTHFHLNKIEEDIIVRHMWPITITPPRYKESFVVTFADKYSASKEYTFKVKNLLSHAVLKRKIKREKRKEQRWSQIAV